MAAVTSCLYCDLPKSKVAVRNASGRLTTSIATICARWPICPGKAFRCRFSRHVRRLFCRFSDCGQRIFTERLPNTMTRSARRTCRLNTSIREIALALGGEGGSSLARQLGILASGSTFLRELRRQRMVIASHGPRVLGIDDWAWRRVTAMAQYSATLKRAKSLTCCRNAARRARKNEYANIPGPRLLAVTGQACMRKLQPKPCPPRFKWLIAGICFIT